MLNVVKTLSVGALGYLSGVKYLSTLPIGEMMKEGAAFMGYCTVFLSLVSATIHVKNLLVVEWQKWRDRKKRATLHHGDSPTDTREPLP